MDEEIKDLGELPALAKFTSTRAVSTAAISLADGMDADHLLIATEHGTAPRLTAAMRPSQTIFALTNRLRACRRVTILPGVIGVHVEEQEDAMETLESAAKILNSKGLILSGQKAVAVTGSPLAMSGRTSTIRVLMIGEGGTLNDLE